MLITCGCFDKVYVLPVNDPYQLDSSVEVAENPFAEKFKIDYESDGGVDYDSEHYYLEKDKGDNGYKFFDGLKKGKLGEHAVNNQQGYYDSDGSRKAGRVNNSHFYKDKNGVTRAVKGENVDVKSSFNKGSKTTGFHNVHHKEEYKKNKQFYDEAHKSGSYRRYGDFGAVLLAAAGAGEKGNRYDNQHQHYDYGKHGNNENGSLYETLKEYGAGNGYDGYYNNNSKYGKSGGASHDQSFR